MISNETKEEFFHNLRQKYATLEESRQNSPENNPGEVSGGGRQNPDPSRMNAYLGIIKDLANRYVEKVKKRPELLAVPAGAALGFGLGRGASDRGSISGPLMGAGAGAGLGYILTQLMNGEKPPERPQPGFLETIWNKQPIHPIKKPGKTALYGLPLFMLASFFLRMNPKFNKMVSLKSGKPTRQLAGKLTRVITSNPNTTPWRQAKAGLKSGLQYLGKK